MCRFKYSHVLTVFSKTVSSDSSENSVETWIVEAEEAEPEAPDMEAERKIILLIAINYYQCCFHALKVSMTRRSENDQNIFFLITKCIQYMICKLKNKIAMNNIVFFQLLPFCDVSSAVDLSDVFLCCFDVEGSGSRDLS